MKHKGVVLVHLGTPRDFSEAAARDFLAEFLGDPDVLRAPAPVKFFLVPRIASRRARPYAAKLREWAVGGEMQLAHYSGRIAEKLQSRLGVPVRAAGLYGGRGIEGAVAELEADAGGDILFIPLYPQYSTATTLPAEKRVLRLGFPSSSIVKSYFSHPMYIKALAESAMGAAEGAELLLGSFHAMPLSSPGVPEYAEECAKTLSLLSEAMGGMASLLGWHSAMDRPRKWTLPSSDSLARSLAQRGVRRIAAICPGFFCDCIETSLDVAAGLRKTFLESGGEKFIYIGCLNDADAHIDLLEKICNEQL